MQDVYAREAMNGLAFEAWLRSGVVPDDLVELAPRASAEDVEVKFNPYHDPATGRFTFAPAGTQGYIGITPRGRDLIRPVGGGGRDRDGRVRPELFAPDPYALHTPAAALAHYVGGSGEDRNFYFNNVDTSQVKLTDFPEMVRIVAEGKPGIHPIVDAPGGYNGDWLNARNTTSAATVGGLQLRANGALVIAQDGRYRFSGRLSADRDKYDFNGRDGRKPAAAGSTAIGAILPGKLFYVNIIGSKPFSARGQR